MTIIYFVRHAQPNFNNHDDLTRELTQQGWQDSKLVTKFLWDKGIDIVLSSPYKRSISTIKEFSHAKKIEIKCMNDFRERKIGNEWIENFDDFCKRQWEDFNFKLFDGESLQEVQNRNIMALNKILKIYKGKNIVIGSHGTALSTIINYFDTSFKYNNFEEIKNLMPWIVKFIFDDNKCLEIQKYNLFFP